MLALPTTPTLLTTYSTANYTAEHTAKPAAMFTTRFYELIGIKRIERNDSKKEAVKERK